MSVQKCQRRSRLQSTRLAKSNLRAKDTEGGSVQNLKFSKPSRAEELCARNTDLLLQHAKAQKEQSQSSERTVEHLCMQSSKVEAERHFSKISCRLFALQSCANEGVLLRHSFIALGQLSASALKVSACALNN